MKYIMLFMAIVGNCRIMSINESGKGISNNVIYNMRVKSLCH